MMFYSLFCCYFPYYVLKLGSYSLNISFVVIYCSSNYIIYLIYRRNSAGQEIYHIFVENSASLTITYLLNNV